ncbi:50S ribosomal protein L25 [Candidatus Saccharibacteria bacterium]|nr:MAG: 50S ribosomal protein L25 [Candidatus Saccharibacteria bacterium]
MAGENVTVDLAKRDVVGKGLAGLRASGHVPAVVHNHGKDSMHVSGEYRALAKAYSAAGMHNPVQVDVDGKKYLTIIKDVHFEPVKHRMQHVVFQTIRQNEKVTAEVPVVLTGEVPAEKKSLIVLTHIDTVSIKALPKNLPSQLEVDASGLESDGDRLTMADVTLPEGVELEADPDFVIATVEVPKDQVAEANAAAESLAADEDKPADEPEAEAATDAGGENES